MIIFIVKHSNIYFIIRYFMSNVSVTRLLTTPQNEVIKAFLMDQKDILTRHLPEVIYSLIISYYNNACMTSHQNILVY